MMWLSGERGIGKSRVLMRIGQQAAALGFRVGVGHARRSPDSPSLWLWRESLPELDAAFPSLATGSVSAGAARFSLFDRIARHITEGSQQQPLALLLDDLHWADEASLRLLEFVAPTISRNRIVLIGTYWDAAVEPGERGDALLGALGHSSGVALPLRALSLDDLAQLAEAASGVPPSDDFARTLLERSGGNPLYALQILATDWARKALTAPAEEQASTMDLQRDVVGTVSQHLLGLSAGVLDLLTDAAVLGRRLDVAKLTVISGLPANELLERLDEAVAGRVVCKGDDGLQFAHGLVRDVLYKRLPSAERSRRHAHAGRELLAHYGPSYELHVQELASHFAQALPEGDVQKTIELAIRAADAEAAAGRPLIAAKFWQHATRALALVPGGDPRQLDVALGLAAAWKAAGREDQARQALQDAEILRRALQP
jgi:predicted ATPase